MKINKAGLESICITYYHKKFISVLPKEFTHMCEYLLVYKIQFLITFVFIFFIFLYLFIYFCFKLRRSFRVTATLVDK